MHINVREYGNVYAWNHVPIGEGLNIFWPVLGCQNMLDLSGEGGGGGLNLFYTSSCATSQPQPIINEHSPSWLWSFCNWMIMNGEGGNQKPDFFLSLFLFSFSLVSVLTWWRHLYSVRYVLRCMMFQECVQRRACGCTMMLVMDYINPKETLIQLSRFVSRKKVCQSGSVML